MLEISDPSGVYLDSEASLPYCNSAAELCASVGTWKDPNDLYIADDGVVRYCN